MKASVAILEKNLVVEYDFNITAHGSAQSWEDPAEPAEFEVEVLAVYDPKKIEEELELPAWLKAMIEDHLEQRDDINEMVQRSDQEDGGPDPDAERD